MYSLKTWIRLLRVQQWYKNVVVFIALLFSQNLFNLNLLSLCLIAFFSLSFVSSANYIINDIKDREKDAKHPLRRERPIAAGVVTLRNAKVIAGLSLMVGLILAAMLNLLFLVLVVILFLLMQVYTFSLKKYLYLDITMIALFFVIRAVLGALAILVWVSPWLIICPFFLAIFLVANKRYADLILLKQKAKKFDSAIKNYSLNQTKLVRSISAGLLILTFFTYSLQNNFSLLFTLPVASIALYRYKRLVDKNPSVGLQTQKAVKDKQLVLLSLLWFILLLWFIV